MLKKLNIFQDNQFSETQYYKKTKEIIDTIKENLKGFRIKYKTLKNNEKLNDRLKFIKLDNKLKTIKSKVAEIDENIIKLEDIKHYLDAFFKESLKEDIQKLEKFLNSYNDYNLKEIEENISNYSKYINNYKYIQEVLEMHKNIFFNNIYESNKNENDEKNCLDKTIEEFNRLKNLFDEDGILDFDEEILKKCFKNLKESEIEEKINELGNILGIKNNNNILILEKLKEKYIFKALLKLIKNYKDQIYKNKEEEKCYIIDKNKNKEEIESCKTKLKEFNLDVNEKYNKYEMLNNLNDHWEIILLLSINQFKFNDDKNEEENYVKNCYNLVRKDINPTEKEFNKELFQKYINKNENVLNDFINLIKGNYLYDVLFNNKNNNFILPREHIKILAKNGKIILGNNKEKWDELIYKSILQLTEDREIKNEELLDMIDKYDIYKESRCQTLGDDDLKIFNGIDISSFPQKNYEDFKSKNFEQIFIKNSKNFYEKINSLINEFKDFKFIFYCFNIQDQDPKLASIQQKFKKLLDDKVKQNDYGDLIDLLKMAKDEKLQFIKKTIEDNSNYKKIYSEILKNDKFQINDELERDLKSFLKKKKIETIIIFASIFILLLALIFGFIIYDKNEIPNKEYNPNEINWNIYNISKEAKLGEKQYNYIEVKNQKIQKLPEIEENIIVGIDFGTISTGYSFASTNDINRINMNGKSPNEIETAKETQNGKKYSERASISLQNYNRNELSNINFVKGIKSIFSLDKFNNDNLCYVYPSEYVSIFNIKNIIREYFILLKKDILENINLPRNKKDKIKWIISVPTAWKEFNKQIIINAAYESGMSNVKLLYENEAASLSMLNDKYIPEKHKNKNKVFILANLGGFYSNITINEIVDKDTIKEKEFINSNAIIENIGVLTIVQEIVQILENIFGKYKVDRVKREDPGEWVKTLKDINEAIRNTYNLEGMEIFKINSVFSQKGEFEYLYKTEDTEKRYIIKNNLDLEFPSGIISNIIQKNINIIINHIDNIMKEMKSKRIRIDSIILTGGLSKNKIVQSEIENKFSSRISVNYLSSTEYAISKGAVFYGINPNRIKSRISPETLGIRIKENGKDNIEILTKRGQEVEKYSMVKFIKPSSKRQDKIQLNVYASNNDNLNEDDFIGRLMIYLDNNRKDEIIQLKINYDTVLSFSAIGLDSKNEIKTKFEIVK